MVAIFDECDTQRRTSHAGALMLGPKNFYDLTNSSNWQAQYPGNVGTDPFPYIGELNGDQGSSSAWLDRNWLGYHGHNRGSACPGTGGPANAPKGLITDWNQWTRTCTTGNYISTAIKQIQPTISYVYGEDLFHRTNSFYNTFRGFVYPVLTTVNSGNWGGTFVLSLYGAMKGGIIPVSDFVDNPTTVAAGGTLSAITHSNPYSAITPVQYAVSPTQWYEPNSTTEPYDPGQMGRGPSQWYIDKGWTNPGSQQVGPNLVRGLQNYGWGFSPDVGCVSPPM